MLEDHEMNFNGWNKNIVVENPTVNSVDCTLELSVSTSGHHHEGIEVLTLLMAKMKRLPLRGRTPRVLSSCRCTENR